MIFENIKDLAKNNVNFRQVIYTGKRSQLVLMSLMPNEDIGEETHEINDQIIFIVKGDGKAILNGESTEIHKHSVVFVTAGTKHNIINNGSEDMKLYTVYAPPAHKDGIVHKTKKDAEKEEKY